MSKNALIVEITMFEDERIISNVVIGIVGKGTQKQRKRTRDKKKSSQLARKKTIFAEGAKLIPIKVKIRQTKDWQKINKAF